MYVSGGFRVVPRVPWNPSFMKELARCLLYCTLTNLQGLLVQWTIELCYYAAISHAWIAKKTISAALEHCVLRALSRKVIRDYYGPTEREHASPASKSEHA